MYAICDFECTGKYPGRSEPLTIGLVVADEDFSVVDVFHRGIKPECPHQWSEEAEAIHGISWARSQKFADQKEVALDMVSFLEAIGRDFTFVCHALPFGSQMNTFDRNVLFYWLHYNEMRVPYYKLFPEEKMISTIKAKRKLATEEYGIKNQRLDSWIEKLDLEKRNKHSALDDAMICLEVLKYQSDINLGGV